MAGEYRVVQDYYRQEHLDFFARHRSPFYSVTFELEDDPAAGQPRVAFGRFNDQAEFAAPRS